ncbi:MAG: SET domain-containing protein [Rhizobacter sp.]|nr:SET domain-containing protein [Chlorobiales bacterium]
MPGTPSPDTHLPDTQLIDPPHLFVQNSSIEGKGIFTAKSAAAGERLMIITGETIDDEESDRREDEENNFYIFWNGDNCYIDTAQTEKIKFINHSCHPNASVLDRDRDSLYLVASRNIEAGEELTIDYGYDEIYLTCQTYNPQCAATPCAAKPSLNPKVAE